MGAKSLAAEAAIVAHRHCCKDSWTFSRVFPWARPKPQLSSTSAVSETFDVVPPNRPSAKVCHLVQLAISQHKILGLGPGICPVSQKSVRFNRCSTAVLRLFWDWGFIVYGCLRPPEKSTERHRSRVLHSCQVTTNLVMSGYCNGAVVPYSRSQYGDPVTSVFENWEVQPTKTK